MIRRSLVPALLIALATPSVALAQSGTGFNASISPIYEPSTSLDRGGKAGTSQVLISGGMATQISPRLRAGVDLTYGRSDWRFDNPSAFGGAAPWDTIDRFGVSVPLVWSQDRWRFGVTPTLEIARESNAKTSDALIYGGVFSATRIVSERLVLGLGLGVFSRIEETRVFPFPFVQWAITDRLRLANPFRAGPAGPAGLELAYSLGDGWDIGTGAAWRSFRFRLDENGRYANGIGETSGLPAYVRLSKQLNRTLRADLWAGASFGQQLKVQDARGNDITSDKQGTVPLLAFTLSARF